MKATIDFVKKKFDEFNRLIFNGELPPIPVKLSNAKTFQGQLSFRVRHRSDGSLERYGYSLRISTRYDLPEADVEDTIIHEMIHYYIFFKGMLDTSMHGTVFRGLMEDINVRYGRHITVTHKSTPEQREAAIDTRRRLHVVALVTLADGREGIKVLPRVRPKVEAYRAGLMASKEVKAVEFYLCDDPFFNRYPVSAALKVYFLPHVTAKQYLTDAYRLDL